ncbi:MAG: SpoIIE family protein phosphatase [Clostridiales bacterium]|nr:SpoIIE family protein phosphatase [Clostridiales bacterium]
MSQIEVATYKRIDKKINCATKKINFKIKPINIFSTISIFFTSKIILFSKFAPFGIIFTYLDEENFSIKTAINILISFIGLITTFDKNIIIKYGIAQFFYIIFIYFRKENLKNVFLTPIASSVSLFISGLIFAFVKKNIEITLPIECLTVFFINALTQKSKEIIFKNCERDKLNQEEKIGILIFISIFIVSLDNISFLKVLHIKNIASVFLILLISLYVKPAETCTIGAYIGLMCGLKNFDIFKFIGTYSLCGLLSGVFSIYGKIGACFSFIFGLTVLKFYFREIISIPVNLFEAFVSAFIIFLIPKSICKKISTLVSEKDYEENKIIKNAKRIKETVKLKIKKLSNSFKSLFENFLSFSEKSVAANYNEVCQIFDQVADKVCKNCKKCEECWIKEFNSTYQVMFKMLAVLEIKDHLHIENLPKYFREKCLKPNEIMIELNSLFFAYKKNFVWKNRINENREIVCEQLKNISVIMDKLSEELENETNFVISYEKKIMKFLMKKNMDVLSVKVTKNLNFKYFVEIKISKKSFINKETCITIISVINAVLETFMVQKSFIKNINDYIFTFCETEKFYIDSGIAKIGYEKNFNGDNYTFLKPSEGKYTVVLSDGMGTGKLASKTSGMAVRLLKQLIETGFEEEAAVKLINSVIFLRFPNDTFTTLDICTINLYSGEIEFIKSGASSSFIKHYGTIETICSSSLPVGVLTKIETKFFYKKVSHGDYIIIFSDGFETKNGDDLWFKNFILNVGENLEPQALANQILTRAIKEQGGNAIDDMTIIVLKVKKIIDYKH